MPWLTIVTIIATLSAVTILLRLCWRLAATSPSSATVVGQGANRRTLLRTKVNCRATLTGMTGAPHDLPVRCVDVGEYGALVLAKQPLDVELHVILSIPSLRMMGVGRVRHCRKRTLRYAVGIEFYGPLQRSVVGDWTIRKQT